MRPKAEVKMRGNYLFVYAAIVSLGLTSFLISVQVSDEHLFDKPHISWLLQTIGMFGFIVVYLLRIWSIRDTQLADGNDSRYRAGVKAALPIEIILSLLAIFGYMMVGQALNSQTVGNTAGSSYGVVSVAIGIYGLLLVGWALQAGAMWMAKPKAKKAVRT